MALDREDLIDGLKEIVSELRARGEHAGIRIVGGAALSLRYFERASTVDIDASIHPPAEVLQIAVEIARRRGWPENWVNTNATMFIPPMRDSWHEVFNEDGVSISVGSPEMLLAMKILKDKALRIVGVIFLTGLPARVDAPPAPDLG